SWPHWSNRGGRGAVPPPALSGRSASAEGVVEVRDQVPYILDADREPDEAVADAQHRPRLRRHGGMRHDGRVVHEALHAAQAFGERKDLAAFEKRPRLLEAALDEERHDAAMGGHLRTGRLVLWVRREA